MSELNYSKTYRSHLCFIDSANVALIAASAYFSNIIHVYGLSIITRDFIGTQAYYVYLFFMHQSPLNELSVLAIML